MLLWHWIWIINSTIWMKPLLIFKCGGGINLFFWCIRIKIIRSSSELRSPSASSTVLTVGRCGWGYICTSCCSMNHRGLIWVCPRVFLQSLILVVVLIIVKRATGRECLTLSVAHSFLLLISIAIKESSCTVVCHKSHSHVAICSSCSPHSWYLILTDTVDHRSRDIWWIRKFAVEMIRLIHCYNTSILILFHVIVMGEVL